MKAALFHKHGGPEVLTYGGCDAPTITPDELLIKVKACSINHLDLWIRSGLRGMQINFPHILGCDISGTIDQIGKTCYGYEIGQEVIVSPGISCGSCKSCLTGADNFCAKYSIIGGYDKKGGYAEFVSVPKQNILPKPKDLSFEESASIPLTFLTAWNMLVKRAKIKTGEIVLIVGGSSGVGTAAI